MSMEGRSTARRTFYALQSPIGRWLQEWVTHQAEEAVEKNHSFSTHFALNALHGFCADNADLVRAFSLAAIARDAISSVTKKFEKKTYGKVWKSEAGE